MAGTEPNRPWYITQRWQQYEGEARANLLRIVAIGSFYLIHLWNFYSSQGKLPDWGFLQLASEGQISPRFHVQVTLLALAWTMLAVAIHFALRGQFFPRWLPTLSILADVWFLTCVLAISNGPRSPLVIGYFLVIVLAALRFRLQLVRLATIASIIGYLCILGIAKWPETFGRAENVELRIPRYQQLVVLLGISLCGILVGQVIRRMRHLAEEYVERLAQRSASIMTSDTGISDTGISGTDASGTEIES